MSGSQLQEWISRGTDFTLFGNTATRWLTAGMVFLGAAVLFALLKRILAGRAAIFAKRTSSGWDDAIVTALQSTRWWFLGVLAAFAASLFLQLPQNTRGTIETLTILTLLLQTALWGNVMITTSLERYSKDRMQRDPSGVTTVSAIAALAKIVLIAVLLLLALDNLGIQVTALIAGLGVGGIAVALAVQNILGDLLASLSIVFDKPFVLGDFIIVADQMGTVEKIGIKTTRLRSLSGEQLVFPNNDLLQSRIRNFKRMCERRVVFSIGVTYETPRGKLEQIPELLREIVTSQENVRFDRAHFKQFGDFALLFEVVYHVLVPDYNVYMDVQQTINLAIYERFDQLGVEFAYPTQKLFLAKGEA